MGEGQELACRLEARRRLFREAESDEVVELVGDERRHRLQRGRRRIKVMLDRLPSMNGTRPDVAEVFPDSESVNKALRAIAEIARERAVKAESE